MFTSFGPSDVGVDRPFPEAARLAADCGFDAIAVDTEYLTEHGPDAYADVLDEHGLRTGAMSLPVDVAGDEDDYRESLDALPTVAEAAAAVGVDRATTYLMSFSDERPFEENFAFHRERLEPVAEVLADHGIDLGLEYLGPATLRAGHDYEFVHTAEGMVELCEAVGESVGLLLDSWHWYTAGESAAVVESLDAADVVAVHLNDAPEGIARDEQTDTVRRLPGETGVIDLTGFLGALDSIGYDGPVMAEPFSDDVDAMADADAARETMAALERVFERAGV